MQKEGLQKKIQRINRQKSDVILAYVFLFVLCAITSVLQPNFLSSRNFRSVLNTGLPYLFVAYAQMMVIMLGSIDLSVGAIISLSNVICARLMFDTAGGFIPGLLLSIGAGALVGFLNGIIVVKGKLQAIIVTLATSSIVSGIALAVLPAPGGTVNADFARFITGSAKGTYFVPFFILVVATVGMWLIMNRTGYGYQLTATGGNEEAAYSSGIDTGNVKIRAFVICGIMSSLSGICIAARIRAGDPLIGDIMTNNSIAAVVVGGTLLAGGKGSVLGTLAGVFILVIINNMLNLLRVSSYYQYLMLGLLLISALAISAIKTRRT